MRRAAIASLGGGAALMLIIAVSFQDNLFRYWHNPREPFQTAAPPAAPNYAQADAWAVRPSKATPDADPPDGAAPTPAVFFVHPSTFWGVSAWNAPLDQPHAVRRLDHWALPTFAGPFLEVAPVWAPRYRQASLYSFLTHHYDARRARALAYEDVAQAFRAFLAAIPKDQPIVIAGVEQGGLHALGLLQHRARSRAVRRRLVAAYVIEQATPLDLFNGPIAPIAPCAEPDAVGCVVAWGAEREEDPREIRRFRRRSMAWDADGRLEATADRALLCVNPVLGAATEDFVSRRNHRGAVNASGFSLEALARHAAPPAAAAQTSAQCRDGVLLVDEPRAPTLRERWRWGGRFKPPSTNLFYADIKADVARRMAAFAAAREAERASEAP